jgi:hypothetical protein
MEKEKGYRKKRRKKREGERENKKIPMFQLKQWQEG